MDPSVNPRLLAGCSQKTLIEIAQGSSETRAKAAAEKLLLQHEPLMKREIRLAAGTAYVSPEVYEDALQAAREGALKALLRFDPSRGFTFGIFARKHIRGRVFAAIYVRVRRRPRDGAAGAPAEPVSLVSLDGQIENAPGAGQDLLADSEEGFERAEQSDLLERTRRFVDGLAPRQGYVVRRVFYDNLSQADVARELGISEAAVSQTLGRVYARGRADLAEFVTPLAA